MEKRHERLVIQLTVIFLIFLVLMTGLKFYLNGLTIQNFQPDSTTGKDTYIRQNSNTSNFNTATTLLIGKDALGRDLRGLIEFNISSLPISTILSAKLQVNLFYASANDNITINLYRLTSPWNSSEATWSNATLSTSWGTVGGDYSDLIDSVQFSNVSQLYNFTITNLVRGWVNGSYSNYGIILISTDAATGNRREIDSSESTSASARPKLIIDYTTNAAPTITNISTNSSLTNPIGVGQNVGFNISWSDLENDNSKAYICNSSSITFASGCGDKTFCSTSLASTNPIQCSYTITSAENRTTAFYVAVCDSTNCSDINQSYFYMNHVPSVLVVQPNGGEIVNQSLGNYSIKFNVSDADNDFLLGNIYYGTTQNSTTFPISLDTNLTNYCTDQDSKTSTTNNCTYSFNSLGLYGTYFLTIIVNDSFSIGNDSSDNSFNIRSIIDSTPPNISAVWIDSDIYAGKNTSIYANVSDASTISRVWASINTTPQINITMINISETYNGSWIAAKAGNYQYKIYAEDVLGNLNDSMFWNNITVRIPNATAQNSQSASTVLPFHTIKVTGELNATDSLRDVYAYLNVPGGFTFLADYPQNYFMGNFSAGQIKNATWFLSVPITEASYVLNITYTDYYSDTWNSSNMNIVVTSAVGGGYELDVSGYPSVAAGDPYYTEAYFKSSGIYTSADSTKISIYDSLGNLIVGPVAMSVKETGIYNYTYLVPGSQTAGQWETRINATKNSINYYANHFWKLVAALFDVRDITVLNSTIEGLNISVVAENVGTGPVDLTLAWNLTRVDTNALLASGGETFAVGATPVTRYYHPSTTYIGQVKIVFMGRYSGTETAGAYKIFSTTSAGGVVPPVTPPVSPGGGGGGGGTGAVVTEKKADLGITVDDIVYVAQDETKSVPLIITNIGEKELTNISLRIDGLDKLFYTISPEKITELDVGKEEYFEIKLLMMNITGEKNITYVVTTNEVEKNKSGQIVILSILDFIRKEIERLTTRINDTRNTLTKVLLKDELKRCEDMVGNVKVLMDQELYIDARDEIKNADDCIDTVIDKASKKGIFEWIENFKFPEIKFPKITIQFWIVVAIMFSLLVLILIILIIVKISSRHKLMKFISKKPETKVSPAGTEAKAQSRTTDKRYFDEMIKRIQERLK
jgi:hypothetical protein